VLYHVYNLKRHGAQSDADALAESRLRQLKVRFAALR
jgi:hypothetical protein